MTTFVDEAVIYAKAGDGGNGCVAWRREAHVPRGGPSGGDGGHGGSVICVADQNIRSLLDFRFRQHWDARNGEPGRGKYQNGSKGDDIILRLPIGTQIYDADTDELLVDLNEDEMVYTILKGGNGGFGNTRFKTSTRQAPDFANPGLPGEQRRLRLSLKLLADVGLLGFPNAGKSTFLSSVTRAKPKIADYPFTTLIPQLGIVQLDEKSFCIADIPGLIEGASEGAGLGIQFLKHLERVRVLLHLIEVPVHEITEDADAETVAALMQKRYQALRLELEKYSKELSSCAEIVAISKADVFENHAQWQAGVELFTKSLNKNGREVLCMSSVLHQGTEKVLRALYALIAPNDTEAVPYNPAKM